MIMKRELILASASPRRKELLEKLDLTFTVCPADVDESRLPDEDAAMYPLRTAVKKAMAIAEGRENALVIAADTVVVVDNDILGKPKDEEEARGMLRRLAGREHIVITGIGIVDTVSGRTLSGTEHTIVYFHPLSTEEIDAYVASKESMDKAGAYGIQGKGSLLVRKIDGDYFNVMGLPLSKLYRLLLNVDADILKKTEF
ncbi:MAG: septum formation protein Maf [Firmicutes bacterium]|nr:septum formation protein Maf [Bacillota bacterium]